MITGQKLVAVVAIAANGVIGKDGEMPWSLPSDLRRYRRLTMGKPMIMGRKTLASIGRVLDGRDTVVLSRGGTVPFEGAHLASTAEEALDLAAEFGRRRNADEIVVAGGGEIYGLYMDRIERLYVTHVDANPAGDAVFPEIADADWTAVSSEEVVRGETDSAPSRFAIYDRR